MLENFFKPNSIAVIGASRKEGKVGHSLLRNILQYGYKGKVYPVNPKARRILGLKTYPRVSKIKNKVDLAIIIVPAKYIPSIIEDCGRKRIDSAIIISAGFKESGKKGSRLEREILKRAKSLKMRIMGPNCLGLIDTSSNLNASFAASMPARGNIAFFSQSGALCTAILDWSSSVNLGFSKFISLGNKMDIDEIDLLLALGQDRKTKVILGYLEGINKGTEFMEAARKVSLKKPVIITKSGRTGAGARAASSHTGTLAGSDTAYNAAFRQSGIIRVETIRELFDYAIAFSSQPLPRGRNLAVITNAGGPGILAADAAEKSILKMASFSQGTIQNLRENLPPAAALYNPVDVIGDAPAVLYEKAAEAVYADSAVDALLAILTPQDMTEVEKTAEIISQIPAKSQRQKREKSKPLFASFMGKSRVEKGIKILQKKGIPNYSYPEGAISSLEAMTRHAEWRKEKKPSYKSFPVKKEKVEEIFQDLKERGRVNLSEQEALEVISAYGFPIPRRELAETSREAVKTAKGIGYPVVLKIASPDILHKSDLGGVRVGIANSRELRTAFGEIISRAKTLMPQALIRGISVQEMIKSGKEVIIGMSRDPSFGPLIMFGLGGIYVEVLKDISFRVAPLSKEDASSMVREISTYPLLKGVRGEKAVDFSALHESLLRVSQLAIDFPQILEMDINPLKVGTEGKGAVALDARITIKI